MFNAGIANLDTNGTTTTFSHPQNENIPSDLSGFYEWSPNLVDWYSSASGPEDGTTVTLTPVTAIASDPQRQFFVRVGVMQN